MSTLKADTIVAADGTSPVTLTKQSAAKAWVNFNGTGTIATRDSFNHSSLTDHDVGKYSNTMASAMNNSNYSGSANGGEVGSRDCFALFPSTDNFTTTTHRVRTTPSHSPDGNHDASVVVVSIHGDLA